LSQEDCPAQHVCAPCFDPFTGEASGACELGADSGPAHAPVVLDACCNSQARCVPKSLIPEEYSSQLATDSCDATHEACVPLSMAQVERFVPQACVVAALGAEGRCLSECLPAVAEQADLLEQDGCAEAHRCVPCFDPLSGEPTGACTFEGDSGPAQPPLTLPACCAGLGRCTPRAYLTPDEAATFGSEGCESALDWLCVSPVPFGLCGVAGP
jgi:hypothetical protein